MGRESFNFEYANRPIFEYIDKKVPTPDSNSPEILTYVMGPYTAFDARRAFDAAGNLESPFIDDPLFSESRHVLEDGFGSYERVLSDICAELRTNYGVRAFIASDVGIPTETQAQDSGLDEPGMTPLDQSIAFSAVSDAVIFIYSQAGLNSGVAAEAGAILGEFNLRIDDPRNILKPKERLRIFHEPDFSSASIDEIPFGYDIDCVEFADLEDLVNKVHRHLVNVERAARDYNLRVFHGY